jgi:hypothetical protein
MLLNGPGQAYVCRRLAPGMGEGTPIEQAEQAITPNAPQISPQPPIIDPGLVALLPQGPLACEHRANGLITGESVRVAHGVMDEEREWRRMGRVAGHRFLLDPQRSIQGRSEEPRYTRCMSPSEGYSPEILPHDTSTSVDQIRGHTNGANGARVPRDTRQPRSASDGRETNVRRHQP